MDVRSRFWWPIDQLWIGASPVSAPLLTPLIKHWQETPITVVAFNAIARSFLQNRGGIAFCHYKIRLFGPKNYWSYFFGHMLFWHVPKTPITADVFETFWAFFLQNNHRNTFCHNGCRPISRGQILPMKKPRKNRYSWKISCPTYFATISATPWRARKFGQHRNTTASKNTWKIRRLWWHKNHQNCIFWKNECCHKFGMLKKWLQHQPEMAIWCLLFRGFERLWRKSEIWHHFLLKFSEKIYKLLQLRVCRT